MWGGGLEGVAESLKQVVDGVGPGAFDEGFKFGEQVFYRVADRSGRCRFAQDAGKRNGTR